MVISWEYYNHITIIFFNGNEFLIFRLTSCKKKCWYTISLGKWREQF